MRRQRPLDVNLWLRKSPPSCEQRYDLKAACLPVNVCLLRSSIMIRAAPWEVLGTSAAAGRSARGRSSGCVRTPKPPQRKLQRNAMIGETAFKLDGFLVDPIEQLTRLGVAGMRAIGRCVGARHGWPCARSDRSSQVAKREWKARRRLCRAYFAKESHSVGYARNRDNC